MTATISVDFDVYCPWDVMNYLLELAAIIRRQSPDQLLEKHE